MARGTVRASIAAVAIAVGCVVPTGAVAAAQETGSVPAPPTDVLQTPPIYTSKDGELHLRVTAKQTRASIGGKRFPNIYTYATRIVGGKGTFTPGTASPYIGPEWDVQPGDRLVIDYVNALPDTEFQAVDEKRPHRVAQPINLHTHGLTVSPAGNSDNVLLSVPQGRSNRYVIDIPADHKEGLYWYHPHMHGLADGQVYEGLAGHIVVRRADGDYRELDGLPVRPMMIRYNVRTPVARQLVDASPWNTKGTALRPRGDMFYTVNGQVAPSIKLNPADPASGRRAESQVWAFTNVTGSATYVLGLEEVDAADATDTTVVGRPLDLTIVSEDGTPMPAPKVLTGDRANYLLGQGGRVALLVQGPSDPTKVVRLVQLQNRSGSGGQSAYDWPNQEAIGGWRDYDRDVLAVSTTDLSDPGRHVDTPATLTTDSPTDADTLASAPVDFSRTFVFNDVAPATESTPNENPVNGALFPFNRVDQPRAGTVEEWTVLNYSSLHHPFHLHVQYATVMAVDAPLNPDYQDPPGEYRPVQYVTDLSQPAPAPFTQDVVNVPPAVLVDADGMPVLGPDGVPTQPGKVVLRVRFNDFLGTYVEHCHRLPHEDRGMMSLVRTIPNDPVLAVTTTADGTPTVSVVRSSDLGTVATLTPFSDVDTVTTAVGDVDRDTIPDVAVASGAGPVTTVRVLSGASGYQDVLQEVQPFGRDASGANVALGDLNADGRDDLVVAQRATARDRVAIFDGESGERLASFRPYDRVTEGVSVATGLVEEGGRISLVTGAGSGRPTVNVYNFDLFGDARGRFPKFRSVLTPLKVAGFDGADRSDRGGITVVTGYPFAADGGFAAILATTSTGRATLRAFTVSAHEHEHDVAASGTFLVVRDYRPAAPRLATLAQTVDLGADPGLQSGAVTGAVSTTTGARLVVAPADGGPLSEWGVTGADGAITMVGTLPFDGASVSGI